jgi:hypothetical protein
MGHAQRIPVAPRCVVVLAMALGGCAGTGHPFPRCRQATAPEHWMLQPGNVLQGIVGDTEGRPVEGAVVRMRRLGTDSASPEREARTANEGVFALDSIPPGRYEARAARVGYGPWADTVELAEDPDVGTVPFIQICTRPRSQIGL